MLLARYVEVFVDVLFMLSFFSFRFVSKERKTSNAVGMSFFFIFEYKRGKRALALAIF